MIYWMARQSRLTGRQTGIAIGALAIFGVYLAVTGLCGDLAGQWCSNLSRCIADPKVGLHFLKRAGRWLPAINSGLLPGRDGEYWPDFSGGRGGEEWSGYSGCSWSCPVQFALYFSYARSVWIGTSLAIFVTLGFVLRDRWRPVVLGGLAAAAISL